jgi:CheY-like chemotaxis protein
MENSNVTILFADDVESSHQQFAQALDIARRLGIGNNWNVEFFKSALGVKSRALSNTKDAPSLVVIDWNFEKEGRSGVDAAYSVREKLLYVPIMILTNYETPPGADERNKADETQRNNFLFVSKSAAYSLGATGIPLVMKLAHEVVSAKSRQWIY